LNTFVKRTFKLKFELKEVVGDRERGRERKNRKKAGMIESWWARQGGRGAG
jgi:hypothetical protein